jgi:Phage tail lysozyme
VARSDYQGVPQDTPDLQAPNDLQHAEASPASFGGQVAQAGQQFGADLLKTADFYGQVAADQATNNFLDTRDKLLYGDPGKTVMGPDGTPQPDTGFLGLRGADAMRARPEVAASLDEAIQEQQEGLQTPMARQAFENQSRRYRAQTLEQVGAHADQQQKVWASDVNGTHATLALNGAARVAGDDAAVAPFRDQVRNAYVKNAQLAGLDPQGALLKADQDVALTRIRTLVGSDDPTVRAGAQKVLDDNRDVLSSLPNYDQVVGQVKGAVISATLDPTVDNLVAAAQAGAQSGHWAQAAPGSEAQLDSEDIGRAAPAVKAFQSKGWSSVAAAGITANLYAESGISPSPTGSNDGGSAYGVFQAHQAYQDAFRAHMGFPMQGSTLQQQEDFLHWDLTQGPDKAVGDQLKTATTPEQAAEIFMKGVERPQDQGPQAVANRQAIARQIAGGQFQPSGQAAVPEDTGTVQGAPGMSTADRLRSQMPTLVANARATLEAKFPNQPDVVDRGVDKFERGLNLTISQQDQQYLVDTHTVQAAMETGKPISEQELEQTSPEVAAAWQRMQVQNPLGASGVQRMFDANAKGGALIYGAEFKDYLDRALAPSTDPNRISNASQMYPGVGSTPDSPLTNTGVSQISRLLAMRGTPQGEAQAAQIRGFVDQAHGQLTFSNKVTGVYDQKGEVLYSKAMAQALPILEQAAKNGTLSQVLDPASPDYVGNALRPFMRSGAEILDDHVKNTVTTPNTTAYTNPGILARDLGGLDSDQQRYDTVKSLIQSGRLTPATYQAYLDMRAGRTPRPDVGTAAGNLVFPAGLHAPAPQ